MSCRTSSFLSALLFACSAPVAAIDAGTPEDFPGAWIDAKSMLHVSVRSQRATRIELSIFSEALDAGPTQRVDLTRDGEVWRASLPAPSGTIYYGYRAWGPNTTDVDA